jgi:hypothetical protein
MLATQRPQATAKSKVSAEEGPAEGFRGEVIEGAAGLQKAPMLTDFSGGC